MTPGDPDERVDAAARHSIEVLYQDNFARVLAYALRRTATAEDAADVAAETFAVAWRRLDEIPAGDGARLWLYGVARNVVANLQRGEVRRRRLAQRLAAQIPTASWTDAHTNTSGSPDRRAIARAWAALTEHERELLALVAWEGLPRNDVAAVLGCSRGGLRVRLHRARRRFARALAAQGVAVVDPTDRPLENDPDSEPGSDAGRVGPRGLACEEGLA